MEVTFEQSTSLCRGCLATGRKMVNARIFQDELKDFAGILISPSDGLPQSLCYECSALVRKCVRFRRRIRKSHNLLSQHILKGTPIEPEENVPYLSTTGIMFYYIPGAQVKEECEQNDISMSEAVKTESVQVKQEVDNEDNIAEQYRDVKFDVGDAITSSSASDTHKICTVKNEEQTEKRQVARNRARAGSTKREHEPHFDALVSSGNEYAGLNAGKQIKREKGCVNFEENHNNDVIIINESDESDELCSNRTKVECTDSVIASSKNIKCVIKVHLEKNSSNDNDVIFIDETSNSSDKFDGHCKEDRKNDVISLSANIKSEQVDRNFEQNYDVINESDVNNELCSDRIKVECTDNVIASSKNIKSELIEVNLAENYSNDKNVIDETSNISDKFYNNCKDRKNNVKVEVHLEENYSNENNVIFIDESSNISDKFVDYFKEGRGNNKTSLGTNIKSEQVDVKFGQNYSITDDFIDGSDVNNDLCSNPLELDGKDHLDENIKTEQVEVYLEEIFNHTSNVIVKNESDVSNEYDHLMDEDRKDNVLSSPTYEYEEDVGSTRNAKPVPCDICFKCFKGERGLFLHKRTHSTDKSRKRRVIHKNYTSSTSLRQSPALKCDFCPKTFEHLRELKKHLAVVHSG